MLLLTDLQNDAMCVIKTDILLSISIYLLPLNALWHLDIVQVEHLKCSSP